MKKKLPFGFIYKKPFDRPNDRFTCGYGFICEKGSSIKGECQKAKGRKCKPVYRYNKLVSMTSWLLGFITLSFVLLMFSGYFHYDFLYPVDRNNPHSTIESCNVCHEKPDLLVDIPLYDLIFKHKTVDEAGCVNCHDYGNNGFSAHTSNLFPMLDNFSGRNRPAHLRAIKNVFGSTDLEENPDHCFACHSAHEPEVIKDNVKSGEVCTQCHDEVIDNFTENHPSFDQYPFYRRTKIIFNHEKHFETFEEHGDKFENTPQECSFCHDISKEQSGAEVKLKSFEVSCGLECHKATVSGENTPSLTPLKFFPLPRIDLASLEQDGLFYGEWPKKFGNRKVDHYTLLLYAFYSKKFSDAKLLSTLKWHKLEDQTVDVKNMVIDFMFFYKKLLYSMSKDNGKEIIEAISKNIPNSGLSENLHYLTDSIPRAMVVRAMKRWFPNIEEEIKAQEVTVNSPVKVLKEKFLFPVSSWNLSKNSFYYKPPFHYDLMIKTIIELAVAYNNHPAFQGMTDKVLKQYRSRKQVGGCLTCHTIDEEDYLYARIQEPKLIVNWRANKEDETVSSLIKFRHNPHILVFGEGACHACHQMQDSGNFLRQFERNDIFNYKSNFYPVDKFTCEICHVDDEDNGQCVQCHKYHATSIEADYPKVLINP